MKQRKREKFPHWHDYTEWANHTTMNRARFERISADEFWEWLEANRDDAKAFFYAMRHPEAVNYSRVREWVVKTLYPGLMRHIKNWPDCLITGVQS